MYAQTYTQPKTLSSTSAVRWHSWAQPFPLSLSALGCGTLVQWQGLHCPFLWEIRVLCDLFYNVLKAMFHRLKLRVRFQQKGNTFLTPGAEWNLPKASLAIKPLCISSDFITAVFLVRTQISKLRYIVAMQGGGAGQEQVMSLMLPAV